MGQGCTRYRKNQFKDEEIISIQKTISEGKKVGESFKVHYTDFIRKKTNMVIDDYKIKSSVLGKGFIF